MAEALPKPLTAASFIEWAMAQPEGKRYELCGGDVIEMASERNRHNLTKQETWLALRNAVRDTGLPCVVLGDGATVIVSDDTVYEPDVTVQCGADIDLDAVTADAPLILVEVMSPSMGGVDTGRKLEDYFQIETVRHYLILNPEKRSMIHHARQGDGSILTSLVLQGPVTLDPPGLTINLSDLFPEE